ncbi:unnamed protein product [Discosporangium mesarthrocarpum]
MSRWNLNAMMAWVDSHIIDYPTAMNLNYNWSFGSAAGFCLGIQILSGAFLAMHYAGEMHYAFSSIEHIMRDVNNGWLLRYLHANGASFFFIVVYCHLFRGLYYGSYAEPRQMLWWSGVIIFILMMATAFMGYVLPWGQMSFWGATVITNFFSVIPVLGPDIVKWVWGGFSVDNPTLNRFFSLHYLLPFLIAAMVFVHLGLLHKDGSNNPLGIKNKLANISFYPYFYTKDLIGFFLLLSFLSVFVFFWPNLLGHPDNYIEANPFSTPAHIVPEWYFLPFYAILRSVPDKAGGVACMGGAILVLFIFPLLNSSWVRSANFRPIYAFFYWIMFADFVLLAWLGAQAVEFPYTEIGLISTLVYFAFFLLGGYALGVLENHLSSRPIKI